MDVLKAFVPKRDRLSEILVFTLLPRNKKAKFEGKGLDMGFLLNTIIYIVGLIVVLYFLLKYIFGF